MSIIDRLAAKWLRVQGYHIVRLPQEQVLPAKTPNLGEYSIPEDFYRYLRPWTSAPFRAWLTPEVVSNTMLTQVKLYFLHAFACVSAHVDGDFLEAGVYNGGSARLTLDVLRSQHSSQRLWLLDTFEGYSTPTQGRDCSTMSMGDCRGQPQSYVENLLRDGVDQVRIMKGVIPASLSGVTAERIAFAHIDVNLYEPTLAATEFCLKRMSVGGILLFDDYGWPATYGARTAIDEACRRFSQQTISIPESTQAFLIKR